MQRADVKTLYLLTGIILVEWSIPKMKLLVKSRLFENNVGPAVFTLYNVCALYQGVCSTPEDVQYSGRIS